MRRHARRVMLTLLAALRHHPAWRLVAIRLLPPAVFRMMTELSGHRICPTNHSSMPGQLTRVSFLNSVPANIVPQQHCRSHMLRQARERLLGPPPCASQHLPGRHAGGHACGAGHDHGAAGAYQEGGQGAAWVGVRGVRGSGEGGAGRFMRACEMLVRNERPGRGKGVGLMLY